MGTLFWVLRTTILKAGITVATHPFRELEVSHVFMGGYIQVVHFLVIGAPSVVQPMIAA